VNAASRLFLTGLRFDERSVDELRRGAESALALGVGGFLIFGGEVTTVGRFIGELQVAAGRPLWFGADLERGGGQQLAGLTTLPPPAALARHPEPITAVAWAGRQTAREARAIGINWALAPVLDLDLEAGNPIVGTRSFGADAEWVARLARVWIEACQAEGVAACAKHFPGHGRTTRDSHMELPHVHATRSELESDLVPFRRVADVVATMMTAHVAYPALAADGPATLSESLLSGLLRRELGFEGVIASDALTMEGVRAGSTRGLEAEALRAGCDLLLCPPDLEGAIRALEDAADPAIEAQIERALARSEAMLARFEGGGAAVAGDRNVNVAGATGRAVGSAAGSAAEEAVHLAEGTLMWLGSEPADALDPALPTGIVRIWDDRAGPAKERYGVVFEAELRARDWTIAPPGEIGAQHAILIASTPQAGKGTAGLGPQSERAAHAALARPGAHVVIFFGHPRALEALGGGGLCAWATEPVMERAAARWLAQRP